MNLHTHQLYLLEQHSESFKILSAIIRINTEGKSLIMKVGPDNIPHMWSVESVMCRTVQTILLFYKPHFVMVSLHRKKHRKLKTSIHFNLVNERVLR